MHISEIDWGLVDNIKGMFKVGDKVHVEIAEIDPRGKLSLVPVVEGSDESADDAGDED